MSKLIFSVALFSAIMVNSCTVCCIQPTVRGCGNLVTETRHPGSFGSVSLSIPAEVYISKGEEYSVVIEGEENIIPLLLTEVKNGKLSITSRGNIMPGKDIRIHIRAADIDGLRTMGSGSITLLDKFSAGSLTLEVMGSGNISAETSARRITSEIRGSGDIHLSGVCREHNISIMGSGDLRSASLESGICKVSVMGSGNTYVWVNSLLDVSIMGSGNVYYKGSPDVETRKMGSGRVMKL